MLKAVLTAFTTHSQYKRVMMLNVLLTVFSIHNVFARSWVDKGQVVTKTFSTAKTRLQKTSYHHPLVVSIFVALLTTINGAGHARISHLSLCLRLIAAALTRKKRCTFCAAYEGGYSHSRHWLWQYLSCTAGHSFTTKEKTPTPGLAAEQKTNEASFATNCVLSCFSHDTNEVDDDG